MEKELEKRRFGDYTGKAYEAYSARSKVTIK